MSLSTSSSDSQTWGRWLATFVCMSALGACVIFALVILVDPYDSGRFGFIGIKGIRDESPRTANASRGRDPQFSAAVFGNSTGQLLKPAELSQATAVTFVQLTVPGTGPREQLVLLRWFVRHHARTDALVIVTDPVWCTDDPTLPILSPFPFWLYSDSPIEYLGRLFSSRALGRLVRRVQLGLGLRTPSARDGYWNYELLGHGEFRPALLNEPADIAAVDETQFPAIEQLAGFIANVANVPVVLVMPPMLASNLPRPGTREAARLAACKVALARLVAGRPHSNFLDFRVDDPLTRDQKNFLDPIHYRAPVARRMEQRIAESLRLGNGGPTTF
ncbi:MAG: hypothetical protein WAK90_06215 [Pseudolabrys sp.]